MTNKQITHYHIKKTDDEYQVQAFGQDGQRIPEADYFTPDLDDAKATAQAMVESKCVINTGWDRV